MLIKNRNFFILISVILIFISLTFIMTFPLSIKINNSISGFYSTDEPSVWYFWWLKYAHKNGLDYRNCQYLAHPYGQDYGVYDTLYPLWSFFKRLAALIINPCFSYNIEIIASYILSGFFMFILARFILGEPLIAFFSGIIYAFSPYHFARAWQHIGLAHIQWMPFYIYALLKLQKKSSWKNAAVLFVAFFLVASYDFYYLYFMILSTGFFVAYFLIVGFRKNLKNITSIIFACAAALLVTLINIWPFIKENIFSAAAKNISAWGIIRPFEDLFAQSARPLSYFLPTTEHPFFGRITQNFIGTEIYGMSLTEHALYLGWVPLILSFIAFRRWQRRSGKNINTNGYLTFFLIFTVFSWLFSQPPWWNILGFKLYMPSFFMYKILPMFRAYCRFGILVMLAIAVLAGFGLKFFLERFKTKAAKTIVTVFFCGLVLFEFWNYPPFKVIDLSRVPQVYYWLKGQTGDFIVAEYPLDVRGPSEKYKFYQTVHEKKIINGTIPGTRAHEFSNKITRLSDLNTTKILKSIGVKYVLVHEDEYLKTELITDIEELGKIPLNSSLEFIKSFSPEECSPKNAMCIQRTGPIDVYEVVSNEWELKSDIQKKI